MKPTKVGFLTAAMPLFLAAGLSAQTPLGPEFRVNTEGAHPQFDHGVAVSRSGEFLVVWQGMTADESNDGLWAQWYSPAGERFGKNLALKLSRGFFQPAVGAGPGPGVTVFWRKNFGAYNLDSLFSGELAPEGKWLAPPRYLITLGGLAPRFIRRRPQGGTLAALIGYRTGHLENRIILLFTDEAGRVIRGPQLVYPAHRSWQYVDGLAMSPSGEFLVSWTDDGSRPRIFAQAFSASGRPLRGSVQMNDETPGARFIGRAAARGDQGYVVAWDDEDPVTGRIDLKMRLLARDGTAQGPVLPVDEERAHHFLGGDIAADAAGNFFVVWQEGGPPGFPGTGWEVWGRLFRPDGTPVGPKRILNTYTLDDQTEPIVAAGANGTFVVVWQSYGQDGDAEGIFGQIFAASPADEVCALGGKQMRCDLARSGGPAELTIGLAGGAEWVTGDWDGDGRDDLCRFAGGSWGCDVDHSGVPDDALFVFGQTGDRPLLGDVDGDGRTDACVQRDTQILCDTARNGEAAEMTLDVGQAGDQIALADVDGDRRSEACVIRGASFLCDTAHDGGAFEWERRFGTGSGQALWGDADGDGRDEPCVLQGSELSCDTAQDGGAAEVRLSFPLAPGERPLLANLDGL